MYLILGAGKSALSSLKALVSLNKKVSICIMSGEESKIKSYYGALDKVFYFDELENINLDDYKYIIRSPGISACSSYIKYLKEKNALLIDESELAYLLTNKVGTYIGVSGSNGKTSVVTLIYNLLKENNDNVLLAGNIGIPLTSLINEINEDSIIVLELSSFQLEEFKILRLNYALLLNLSPNHLDAVESLDFYYNSKFNISYNQTKYDFFLVNYKDKEIKRRLKRASINSKVINFHEAFKIKRKHLYYEGTRLVNLDEVNLMGSHNLDNIKAVIKLLKLMDSKINLEVIKTMKTLPHRLETLELNQNFTIINDSKSTSSGSLISALKTYRKHKIILIFGGLNKNIDFKFLNTYKLKNKICYGELATNLNNKIVVDFKVSKLETAIKLALNKVGKGDVILFSPGCASFDQFKSYYERGEYFNTTIRRLVDEQNRQKWTYHSNYGLIP